MEPATAHALAANAVMRQVQQDLAVGALTLHVAVMDSMLVAADAQIAPEAANPCARQRCPRCPRRTKLRRLRRIRKRPHFSPLWRHLGRQLRQPTCSYRCGSRMHSHKHISKTISMAKPHRHCGRTASDWSLAAHGQHPAMTGLRVAATRLMSRC